MTPRLLDHLFILLLTIVLPVYGLVTWKSFKQKLSSGNRKALLHAYVETMIIQWLLFGILLVTWFFSGRPFGSLGFSLKWNLRFFAGMLLTVAGCGFLIRQWIILRRMENIPDTLKVQIEPVVALMPQTQTELKCFVGVSITAGVCEEAFYRGFLIWYLGNYLGLLSSALISVLIFGFAHAYQGKEGMVKTSAMGVILTGIYLLSGSILGPVLLHAVTDATSGLIGSRVARMRNEAGRESGASDASLQHSEAVGTKPTV